MNFMVLSRMHSEAIRVLHPAAGPAAGIRVYYPLRILAGQEEASESRCGGLDSGGPVWRESLQAPYPFGR